jgi:hypothetical protein
VSCRSPVLVLICYAMFTNDPHKDNYLRRRTSRGTSFGTIHRRRGLGLHAGFSARPRGNPSISWTKLQLSVSRPYKILSKCLLTLLIASFGPTRRPHSHTRPRVGRKLDWLPCYVSAGSCPGGGCESDLVRGPWIEHSRFTRRRIHGEGFANRAGKSSRSARCKRRQRCRCWVGMERSSASVGERLLAQRRR